MTVESNSPGLRIGILGTRGVPNRYGGFEQCAAYLAAGLVARGHEVTVYNSHNHEYQLREWEGAKIVHCYDPEHQIGTAGQFIYDLNCIRDTYRRDFNVILQLGYTSSSLWARLWPAGVVHVVNMDGLEWMRSKYSARVRWFLKHAEKWAARRGDMLIADSTGIRKHLKDTYGRDSVYIPYGAELFENPDTSVPAEMGLEPGSYHLLIARMEPENNIEMIIRGYLGAEDSRPLVIVGKTDNRFGTALRQQYGSHTGIVFAGGIYDACIINNLRYHSAVYFHGHSVGGTNPSLLEAMACRALIAANDNIFNRSILGEDAFYFKSEKDIPAVLKSVTEKSRYEGMLEQNINKIAGQYNWPAIVEAYEKAMYEALSGFRKKA